MKSAQIAEYGNAESVRIVETENPPVGPKQVLVEVSAASLNPFDTMVREGYVSDAIPLLPVTLGGDFAGTVSEVGDGVSHVTVGDKVYGQANVVAGNSGSLAEYAVTKAEQVAKAPANITLDEAASLPLVAVSAYQALVEELDIQPGQRLFIHGGSGGIGTIAIQIAKNIGAHVTASARGDGVGLLEQLGADDAIDTENQDIAELANFDAVFDTVGGDDFTILLGTLKQGGKATSMIAEADGQKAKELGVTASTQATHVTTQKLDAIRDLVEAGVIKPQVGKIFELDDIIAAFQARESGNIVGKIVISIKK